MAEPNNIAAKYTDRILRNIELGVQGSIHHDLIGVTCTVVCQHHRLHGAIGVIVAAGPHDMLVVQLDYKCAWYDMHQRVELPIEHVRLHRRIPLSFSA